MRIDVFDFTQIEGHIKHSIVIGIMRSWESFQKFDRNGIYKVSSNDDKLSYHGVLINGFGVFNGGPYYEVLNSWGPRYFGDGYIFVSHDLFTEIYVINGITNVASDIVDTTMVDTYDDGGGASKALVAQAYTNTKVGTLATF
ncbi:hypothetical protein LIER_28602 [Lithospermum erythrorhizon]|uniref:Peptidase C1A papain C-terminal domain-containing protein n=1 Tax=Lithospermum erythrorhizon TaxID=34254 RepID=A0AAV3RJJ0_LITER